MKQLKLILLLFIYVQVNGFCQPKEKIDKTIKIYAVSWQKAYRLARTINNIRQNYIYYFETEAVWLNKMFLNYEDCINQLASQSEVITSDTVSGKFKRTNVLVELYYSDTKVVSLYFNDEGDFYFQDKWHTRNDELYYSLFRYFSDELIPASTLELSKKNHKDGLWHGQ